MSLPTSREYDIAIVGGGMVGVSLVCLLQDALIDKPLNILLIESSLMTKQKMPTQPSFDARSTVLSYGSVQCFKKLGLWNELSSFAEAIKKIHVSDQGKFGSVRMCCDEHDVDALGYVVENKVLGIVLNKALLSFENVEICDSAKVVDIKPKGNGNSVFIEKAGEDFEINAGLVVVAEGGRSGLCEKIGIHRTKQEYKQTAIISNVTFSESHNNIAYERFTSKGPLALLPLQDINGQHRAALIWTHSSDSVEQVMSLSDGDFLEELQNDFSFKLGAFSKVGERFCYPLSLQKSEEQIRSGIVLLGNVAHSLHPVAGQGFNLALRDAMNLSKCIANFSNNSDGQNRVLKKDEIGSIQSLQRYLTLIENDQDKTIAFSHYMTNLFSNTQESLIWARKVGLLSIDLITPLKKGLGKQAMGLADLN